MPPGEIERLRALGEYGVFDTPPEDEFDRLVDLAARLFGTPYAVISLVGHDRLYFKSHYGTDLTGIDRDGSFCAHAVLQDDLFLVTDALKDERFCQHPHVSGPPNLRFYAGVPLVAPSQHKIGTICVLDDKPRSEFSGHERKNLEDVATLVMNRLELRRLSCVCGAEWAQFLNLATASHDAIVCTDADGKIKFWNPAATSLFGYAEKEVVARPISVIFPEYVAERQTKKIQDISRTIEPPLAESKLQVLARSRQGNLIPIDLAVTTHREETELSICMILRDAASKTEREQRLFGLLDIDPVTGAHTRSRFYAELRNAINSGVGAVLTLDFDKFKDINSEHGYSSGDRLLRAAVKRIRDQVRSGAFIGRIGGDSFAIVLPNAADHQEPAAAANDLLQTFEAPFTLANKSVRLTASIGRALIPDHGSDPDELLANANLGLHSAKVKGGNRHISFEPNMRRQAIARYSCDSDLRRAFECGEFEIHYQPQVRLSDRAVTGAEALLRWRHPTRGLLPPAAFLPVLQAGPLAAPVGSWLLRTACADATRWQVPRSPEFRVSVNLFETQFRDGNLTNEVREALQSSGLSPKALEIEITENIALKTADAIINSLQQLRDDGVGISFDDYGTGYACLSLLKTFPLTRLKIDQAFIQDLCEDKGDAAIIQAIIYIGRKLGLSIIAEGIETEEQETVLRMYGCTEGQGFLFSPALSAQALTDYLRTTRPASDAPHSQVS